MILNENSINELNWNWLMLIETSPTLPSLSSQWAINLRVVNTVTHRGCCGHGDTLDKRSFNWAALISVDGVWGGMLIWVIAYVNAQLGSSQCQNTSARVSACHPTLAPTRWVDRSDKHTPQWAVLWKEGWAGVGISAITSSVNIKLPISLGGLQSQNAMQLHPHVKLTFGGL